MHRTAVPAPASRGTDRPGTPRGTPPAPDRPGRVGLIGALTSRRGAWLALLATILLLGGVSAGLGKVETPSRADAVPTGAESARAAAAAHGIGDPRQALLVVLTRDGRPVTDADRATAATLRTDLAARAGHDLPPAAPSADGKAMVLTVPVTPGPDGSGNKALVKGYREAVAGHDLHGLKAQVTGGPAFGADVAAAFDGADLTLLLVTLGIVAVLLLITYRSPVLMLVPLTVVALADRLAGLLTAGLAKAWNLQVDSGIVSVLVFGAGTNYALLMISRYREELRHEADHRAALRTAWRGTLPAILASNLTVVLALLTLGLATLPGTRGLGIASAAGLLVALAFVLLVLPAALSLVGRRAFWPMVPRVEQGDGAGSASVDTAGAATAAPGPCAAASRDSVASAHGAAERGVWARIARGVLRRPGVVALGGALLLAVLAGGLVGTRVGLSQVDRFRVPSESAAGLETLAAHYPAGEAAPLTAVVPVDSAEAAASAARAVPGVVRVMPVGTANGQARLQVVTQPEPGSDAAVDLVRTLRDRLHEAAPGSMLGGGTATDVDSRDAAAHDLRLVAPLVLLAVLLVLAVLLRAVVAPLVLLAVNAASALAAMGAGAWLSRHLLGMPALDVIVPLVSFLFLVALGIDYTIFLVHRARAEVPRLGTHDALVVALARTGGVITSAGVVLAGVFAALGVLPLVTLTQIGLVVGLGVVVDTFVVRTLLVPAVLALLGDRAWWPGLRRSAPNLGA